MWYWGLIRFPYLFSWNSRTSHTKFRNMTTQTVFFRVFSNGNSVIRFRESIVRNFNHVTDFFLSPNFNHVTRKVTTCSKSRITRVPKFKMLVKNTMCVSLYRQDFLQMLCIVESLFNCLYVGKSSTHNQIWSSWIVLECLSSCTIFFNGASWYLYVQIFIPAEFHKKSRWTSVCLL